MLVAVFDASVLSATVDDVPVWVSTAPAMQNYSGEVDNNGLLMHKFSTANGGEFTLRCNPATGLVTTRGRIATGPATYWTDRAACQAIADALQLPPEAIKANAIETGLTIGTDGPPTAFLAKLARSTYGPTQASFYATEPPRKAANPLQYISHCNEVRVKVYDRGTWAKLKNRPDVGNCLRFELHYLKSRRIGAAVGWNGSITLANLMQADVYQALAGKLLASWKAIHIHTPMDNHALDADDLALFVMGQNPAYWEAAKPHTAPKTYQRRRARFKELQRQVEKADTANPYSNQVEQLVAALKAVDSVPFSPLLPGT